MRSRAASANCFFFSSRRRHTRLQGDWSSDVCSSDLIALTCFVFLGVYALGVFWSGRHVSWWYLGIALLAMAAGTKMTGLVFLGLGAFLRSEERRVGKECRSRWSPYH